MRTLICALLSAGASLAAANKALAIPDPLSSATEALLLSSSITGPSSFKTQILTFRSATQAAVPHVLVEDNADTSIATATNPDTDKSLTAAEPDASLQIAFLVLGALLALASVVVAIFFGYKQLRSMRRQSSIGHNNNVHDNPSSGVDIEMGPATDRSGPARPSAQPSSTNQVPTGFAHFLDQLKSICAAVSSPISGHEGQPPLPNQDPAPVHESLSAPVETSQGHQEGNATLPTATQRI